MIQTAMLTRKRIGWLLIAVCVMVCGEIASANLMLRPRRGSPSGFFGPRASDSLSRRSRYSVSYGNRGGRRVHHARHNPRGGRMAIESVYLGRKASAYQVNLQPAGKRGSVRYAHAGRPSAGGVKARRGIPQTAGLGSTGSMYQTIKTGATATVRYGGAGSSRASHARGRRSMADNSYQNIDRARRASVRYAAPRAGRKNTGSTASPTRSRSDANFDRQPELM